MNTSSQHFYSILERLKSGDASPKDTLHLQNTNNTLTNLLPAENILPVKNLLPAKLTNFKVRSVKKHLFVELGTYKMSKFDLDNKSSSSSDSLNEIDLLGPLEDDCNFKKTLSPQVTMMAELEIDASDDEYNILMKRWRRIP